MTRAEVPTLHLDAWRRPSILPSADVAFPSASSRSWVPLAAQRGQVDLSIVPQLRLRDAPPPGEAMPFDARAWMTAGAGLASRPMVPDLELTLAPSRPRSCADLPGTPESNAACSPGPVAQTDRKGLHEQLWFVTIELFAVQSASIAIFAALPTEISGFTNPDIRNIARFAAQGPHFDDDRWAFNYIGHPLAGSEYYLIARNRGAAAWQAMLYAAAWSTFWEYVTEGLYERASIQDLIVTPVSGAVLGELRHQLRRAIVDANPTKAKKFPLILALIALDPIQTIAEAVPLRVGASSSP